MPPDGDEGQNGGDDDQAPVAKAHEHEDAAGNRQGDGGGDGGDGHVAGAEKKHHPQGDAGEEDPDGVEADHDARGGGDALAALEAEPDGEIVPEDDAGGGDDAGGDFVAGVERQGDEVGEGRWPASP